MDCAKTIHLNSTMRLKYVLISWVEERDDFEEALVWTEVEESLVQILVVVVITNMRTIWAEVENGFRWRAFRSELVDPKRFVKYDKKWKGFINLKAFIELKGKLVKIPVLDFAAASSGVVDLG